ncbi:MAG: hypothetical protein AABW48_03725 [Nanoarchaeota archaeon]
MTLDTLVKKLRKHEDKLMDYTGVTYIVGVSLASSSYLLYGTIHAASKGDYEGAAFAGILSILCAFSGGYHTKGFIKKT